MKIILPKPIIFIERWKYSKVYGIYVSNRGNFRDKNKQVIKPMVGSNGYLSVQLKYGTELAHRIVAAVWLPCEDMYHLTVDHLDHNKRNNSVSNLEWVTEKENLQRAQADLESTQQTAKIQTSASIAVFTDAEYKNTIISFDGAAEAAKWVRKKHPELCRFSEDSTIERIAKACNKTTTWCTYYWKAL